MTFASQRQPPPPGTPQQAPRPAHRNIRMFAAAATAWRRSRDDPDDDDNDVDDDDDDDDDDDCSDQPLAVIFTFFRHPAICLFI